MGKNVDYQSFIRKFLNVYWLRPENAIFSANLALAVSRNFNLTKGDKIMELGTGDGIFSFLTFGGEFDKDFDVYGSTKRLLAADHKDDVFDSYTDSYCPIIANKPNLVIDIGYDLKENLIKKASKLNLYQNLEVADVINITNKNKYNKIFLFSAIYHMQSPVIILKKITDMLAEDGVLYINTISPEMTRLYSSMDKVYDASYVKFIERGMRNLWPSIYTVSEWELMFQDAGLSVKKIETIVTKDYAPIWNIGNRSFVSQHIEMYNITKKYRPKEAENIKQGYIDRVLSFSNSFEINNDNDNDNDNDAGCLFLLQKSIK